MKKIISMILIFMLGVCLVACGEKDLPLENKIDLSNQGENENVIGEQVIKKYFDESLLEQYAETQVIKLPENPTTGYEWVFFIDDSEVVTVIEDKYESSSDDGNLVGVVGNRVCEFKGLKEGDTTIEFNYLRGFESNEEPAERVKFHISVNAKNEIAVIDEIH